MSLTIEQLEFLRTPRAAELLAMDLPADPLHAVDVLRRHGTAQEASAVATLRALRHRAEASGRFPPGLARGMLASDTMLQQASSYALAVWMGRSLAARAAAAGGTGILPVGPMGVSPMDPLAAHVGVPGQAGTGETPMRPTGKMPVPRGADPAVLDLCVGFGADAIGLALAGFRVRGVDVSPSALLCAAHNAAVAGVGDRCTFEQADVTQIDLPAGAIVHVDPDRRATGRRTTNLADCRPDVSFLRHLPGRTAAGAIKLSPAIDPFEAGDLPVGELEYVSEHGVCKQLVAWWGPSGSPGIQMPGHLQSADGDRHQSGEQHAALAPVPYAGPTPRRTATILTGPLEDPQAVSLPSGVAPYAPLQPAGEWLIEPDPAVIAAQAVDDLAAACGLWRLEPGLAWLFGDKPVDTPLARSFRVLADVPGRPSDVARAVRQLGGGSVEVKTRGVKLDTDRLQRQLAGRGSHPLAILWCRTGRKERAFICQREQK
jgi:hypothetical protein